MYMPKLWYHYLNIGKSADYPKAGFAHHCIRLGLHIVWIYIPAYFHKPHQKYALMSYYPNLPDINLLLRNNSQPAKYNSAMLWDA